MDAMMTGPFKTTLAVIVLLASSAPPALAGTGVVGLGGTFRVPVESFQERPFGTVTRQQFDYSCGSAALATLLTHHYGKPVGEPEVFQAMYEAGDKERIQEVGFSLLDMKHYLEGIGLRADGFRLTVDKLAEVGVPAISLIELDGYRHFVVVKGILDDQVLIGDPARGVQAFTRAGFEEVRVDDIVFLIRDEAQLAKANFNKRQDWRLRVAAAPLNDAVARRALASHGDLARIPSQFNFPMTVR
jgi:predicted double-glycine peptidase